LNGPALVSEAKEEQNLLRDELKTVLDELTYEKLAEKDSNINESAQNVLKNIPPSLFVG
jgi:vacuolar-type H+-ATPase subunit H